MPAPPAWFTRIPAAIEQLLRLEDQLVTRAHIEVVFGLSKRSALGVLRRAGADRVGTVLAIPAGRLVERLEALVASDDFARVLERRRRVVDAIRLERAHHVRFRVPERQGSADGLPAGVRVRPGEITVRFATVEEALQRLFLLAQAITVDYERFVGFATRPSTSEAAEDR